jgi:hypothetical protein
MRAVGADNEIRPQSRAVDQCDVDTVVTLVERGDVGVEAVFDGVLGGLVQHVDQVAAKDLELGDETVAVESGHRHFGTTAAVGPHPGHTGLLECMRAHLRHQAHALDDVTAGAAQVDGLAAGTDPCRDLDDDDAIAVLGQPEGERGSGDACAADQDGGLGHG